MIKVSKTNEWCICKNTNGKINLIMESRDKIEFVNGEWQIKSAPSLWLSNTFLVRPIDDVIRFQAPKEIAAPEYDLIHQLMDISALDSLTVEEPIVLHFKTTIELTYTIE